MTGFVPEASKKYMFPMGKVFPDSKVALLNKKDEFEFIGEFYISLNLIRKALRALGRCKSGYDFGMYILKERWVFYLALKGDCILIAPRMGPSAEDLPHLSTYLVGLDVREIEIWNTLRKLG
jgi:hypothetical protein